MSGCRQWAGAALQTVCVLVFAVGAAFALPGQAQGYHHPARSHQGGDQHEGNQPLSDASLGTKINANTVGVISANPNGAWLRMAYDLSAVLDDGSNFRVLPVIGKGGAQNIRDVRYLKGIDVGFTVTTVLNEFRRTGVLGDIVNKIDYIARLDDHDMYVVVQKNSGITSIAQLSGKKVNFSDMGSATEVSARHVFKALGVTPIEVNMGQADAYVKIKNGELAATVQFSAMPSPAVATLHRTDGFRLLPIPYDTRLQQNYLPATLANADYPSLISKGQNVNTIAYGAVLIAYNWPEDTDRYRRVAKFVDRFFSHFSEFQKPPRDPAWRQVNLAATLPGWHRFPEAQAWLDSHRRPAPQASAEEGTFDQFLAQRGGPKASLLTVQDRDALFREFLQWNQQRHEPQNTGE
jgi:TRAP transporter TAXI family solute receptor